MMHYHQLCDASVDSVECINYRITRGICTYLDLVNLLIILVLALTTNKLVKEIKLSNF